MSECKKTCGNCAGRIESILSKDRCDMTRNTIENYSNTCNLWEPNRETKVVMQKDELKALRQERDELQAQVAVLRWALGETFSLLMEIGNDYALVKRKKWFRGGEKRYRLDDATLKLARLLNSTTSKTSESVQRLVEALEAAKETLDANEYVVDLGASVLVDKALAEWWCDIESLRQMSMKKSIASEEAIEKELTEAREQVAGLTKERDDYVEGLREIELGGQPADNIARWTLEKWGKSTQ